MIQFYLLSVVLNILCGLILSSSLWRKIGKRQDEDAGWIEESGSAKISLGILSILVGILKFLSTVDGDVRVVGDFFPAISGLLVGFALLTNYYSTRSSIHEDTGVSSFLKRYHVVIGCVAIGVGVIHFLLPRVLFL